MKAIWEFVKAKRELILLLLILLLSLALRLAFLHEPFERDEGQYAAIGQEILRGGIPYRDAIEIKPPGAFYLYALAISLFGATTEGIRLFTACYSLLTVAAIFFCTRRFSGSRAGMLAALIYGVYSSAPIIQGSSSNTEVFLVLPMVLGTWCFLAGIASSRRSHLALCGFSVAVAVLIKPVAITLVLVICFFLFFIDSSRENIRGLLMNQVSFILPGIVLAVLVIGYFFRHGALEDFLYWTVQFAGTSYGKSFNYSLRLSSVIEDLAWELLLPVLAAVPAAVWLVAGKRSLQGLFVAALLPAAVLSVCLPGKFFPHYFIVLLPSLAILGGTGLDVIMTLRGGISRLVLISAIIVFLCSAYQEYPYYLHFTPEQVSRMKYGPIFVDSTVVAGYIRNHTSPDDYIFQWGFEPELYFLSGRRSPDSSLVSMTVGWAKDPAEALRKMVAGINEKQPKYIIVQRRWAHYPGETEVNGILAADYLLEEKLRYAELFIRKTEQP